jgi:hypothetical protein
MVETAPDSKRCSACKTWLPRGEFHKNRSKKDGLADECKACFRKRQQNPKAKAKERARDRKRGAVRRRGTEYKLYQRLYFRKYSQRTEVKVADRKRKRTEKAKAAQRLRNHRRRAAMRGTSHKPYTLPQIWQEWGGFCVVCEKPVSLDEATIEHIIQFARGGCNTPQNVGPSHAYCNGSKGPKVKSKPKGLVRVPVDPLRGSTLGV